MKYQRDEHRVHLVVYHLVWCPKRRKPVLVGKVAERLRVVIHSKCDEQFWEVMELAIQPDHVHLFIRATPSDSGAEIVRQVKGITSHHLRKEFPHLLRLPSLWTRSYFCSTAENISAEIIQRYVEAQKGI
jgi:putative transposase